MSQKEHFAEGRVRALVKGDPGQSASQLEFRLAIHADEVAQAQKLRHRVFSEEYGVRFAGNEVDQDEFDQHCDHLLVRRIDTGEVVGTYRMLPPKGAKQVGHWYSEQEFDMRRLHHLRDDTVEVGRSCVAAEYRQGAAIMMLWSGIAQYMKQGGFQHLIGCASVSMKDGGHQAASVYHQLQPLMAPPELQASPRVRFPFEKIDVQATHEPPALVKGYMRLGAKVCAQPAWDPDFNSADFLLLLSVSGMNSRYARHFGFI